MATGLFDSPSSVVRDTGPAPADEYRALAGVAIAAAALALLSPLAFIDWWLAVVPILAMVLGSVALRDIARRPAALTGRTLAIAAILVSGVALVGGLSRLALVYAAELPAGFERLSYAELQPLPGDPADAVPETARAADGRDVLLKGYMYPGKQTHGIRQFLLVRDQGDCCFGGNPKITDRVLVQLAATGGIDFTPRLVKIAGRFHVRPAGAPEIGGGVLYHIEDARPR
ncbi:MAG: DUF4190 domain-containing protein [Planctomycetaceae bacterium]|nr:DUF4190 domain-containing protein [Planctomycetaceae bacterium]